MNSVMAMVKKAMQEVPQQDVNTTGQEDLLSRGNHTQF